ncbi:MAG: TatD family hydrolase [Chitinispirillaceae bacterium]|nr:TatD family hydrolase [Chitinispirillaceae bacterium]
MQLFDSHCHLQDERIVENAEAIIGRALAAGVKWMLCCGSAENDWHAVIALAGRFPCIIPALGIHPWYVAERREGWLDRLEALLRNDPRIALGEIGLDHALKERDDGNQINVFYEQLRLARKLGRPASIHCRTAWGSLMELLRRERGIAVNSVIHSYSGPVELVAELVHCGVSISFSGSITYEKNRRGRDALRKVPDDRLLIETDSPDIPPVNHTGSNEPAMLIMVAKAVARLRGACVDEIGAITVANGNHLFRY